MGIVEYLEWIKNEVKKQKVLKNRERMDKLQTSLNLISEFLDNVKDSELKIEWDKADLD